MGITAAIMVPHPPLIVPEVGRGGEAQIEETKNAYEQAAKMVASLKPETIIIPSPHAVMYSDYFCISSGKGAKGSFADFGAPQVRFDEEYDTEFVSRLCMIAEAQDFPAGILGNREKMLDHGTMVPLWFVRKYYQGGRIVRIGLSGLPLTEHYRLGQMIKEVSNRLERRTVIIASGDLSHKLKANGPYGFAPEGPVYDERIMDVCGRAAFGELFDFDESFCEKAAECGHRSFVIMAGAFDCTAVEAKVLSHQDVTGVGYGICTFMPKGEDPNRNFLGQYLKSQKEKMEEQKEKSDVYVRLARASAESYVRNRKVLKINGGFVDGLTEKLPKALTDTCAGAFVSIHEHGRLRGCIGTILPVRASLAEEIIENAVSAAVRDPRFDPIKEEELPWLEISVDVLTEPENIASSDELDVKKYGVIVSSGHKRGLLLPDLDGVDTVDQQIHIAMQKAGIRNGEKITLQRFEVVRHT